MSKPRQTDNFEKIIYSLEKMKKYHDSYRDVKKYLDKLEILIHLFRKPSASTVYVAALDLTEEVATKTLVGKLIFSIHGPHLQILGDALKSSDKFCSVNSEMNAFSRSLEKLKNLRRRYMRDFKYDMKIHGQGIISYSMLNFELFEKTQKGIVEEHLQSLNSHVKHIVNSIDYFLWFYVRINPHYLKLKKAVQEVSRNPANLFDDTNGKILLHNFELAVKYKIGTRNYRAKAREVLKLRNEWANWLNKPIMSEHQYLSSSLEAFGGKLVNKPIRKDPSLWRRLTELLN